MKLWLPAFILAFALPSYSLAQCEKWGSFEQAPPLEDERIDESSGLASSRVNPNSLWTHNDSGDSARLFLLDESGATTGTVELQGIDARDWEDMAIGPCADSSSCLYVADIGDNLSVLDDVVIHRFPEPELNASNTSAVATEIESLRFSYPDGPRDAEALLIHPTGRIFVADKVDGGTVSIYEVPPRFGETVRATKIATLELTETNDYGNLITAGDFSPDGSTAVLKTYFFLYTFCGTSEDPIALFNSEPVMQNAPLTLQGETVAWDAQRARIWVTSERLPTPVFYLDRVVSEADVDAGPSTPIDAGTTDVPDAQTDTGDADASPGPGTSRSAEKEGCQAAGGRPTSLLFVAFLLLSAVMSRRGLHFARRRTSACGPAS